MALGDGETRRQSVVSGGARRQRRQCKGEEGGALASASASASVRGRKLDHLSAGRKGSTGLGDGEERQTRRGKKGKGKGAGREGGGARWRGRNIPSDGDGERGGAGSAGEGREGEKGEKIRERRKKRRGGKNIPKNKDGKKNFVSIFRDGIFSSLFRDRK